MKKRTVTVLSSKTKTSLKIRIFDSFVVFGFFLSLIPIRLFFVENVNDNWIGSFGLITAISGTILYFGYKEKLGWFGRSFMRFFRQRHTKKKIFLIIQGTFAVIMLSIFIYSVEYADDRFEYEREELVSLLPNAGMETTEKLTEKSFETMKETPPEMIFLALVTMVYIFLYEFDKFALALWTVNHITGGMYLNLATIVLIEEIEVIGLFFFFHFFGKKLRKMPE